MTNRKRIDGLRRHLVRTYTSLRYGVGIIGGALPLVLWLGGWIGDGEPLRGSMSAYYYSPAMRDVFVGALITVGVILYLYRGFSTVEDWALNLAGIFAVGVALVPTTPPGAPARALTWHGTFAVAFFICIAYVCIFRASDTLSLVRWTDRARRLRLAYRLLGYAMIVAPLLAAALAYLLRDGVHPNRVVFAVEAAGVWVFSAYWLYKSRELSETGAAEAALAGKLRRIEVPQAGQLGRLVQVEPDRIAVQDWSSLADLADGT